MSVPDHGNVFEAMRDAVRATARLAGCLLALVAVLLLALGGVSLWVWLN